MADYRLVWTATGATIGYLHNVDRVVSGSDLTFFFDSTSRVISETNTANISFVEI